ncbi:MAG: hypothetical protein JJ869_13655 [Marivita sp.]|uniref:hypothetical protein n=1 Tax=Marivita sp. TaxID=2003365 RepID=UPI001B29765E|nr:hypothetical protein [Marivita sp.]MBO6884604.1 hypothetical protein [Marivita sp.]
MRPAPPILDDIQAALNVLPDTARLVLVRLREAIFEVASTIQNAGQVTETLKWGQPSYAVATGTPLRLGITKTGGPATFVHCQTTVVADERLGLEPDLPSSTANRLSD